MFTKSEIKVIRELLKGGSNKDIALTLNLEVKTVEYHLHAVSTKTEGWNRTKFVTQFYRTLFDMDTIDVSQGVDSLEAKQIQKVVREAMKKNKPLPMGFVA